MLRLDKFLCDANIGSRSQVKALLKKKAVKVNGEIIDKPEYKVKEGQDKVTFQGKEIKYHKYVYYMLNKPKGVVSATKDNLCQTAAGLLSDSGYDNLFPVGRLDKDTEGLLIMTNDGELAHRLLSPKNHVDKVYYVELDNTLTEEGRRLLEAGVDIGEEKPTLPAKAERITDTSLYLTLREGKYHQVKRMLKAVGCQVAYLKRIAMGGISLDESLPSGCYRELTKEERKRILL